MVTQAQEQVKAHSEDSEQQVNVQRIVEKHTKELGVSMLWWILFIKFHNVSLDREECLTIVLWKDCEKNYAYIYLKKCLSCDLAIILLIYCICVAICFLFPKCTFSEARMYLFAGIYFNGFFFFNTLSLPMLILMIIPFSHIVPINSLKKAL